MRKTPKTIHLSVGKMRLKSLDEKYLVKANIKEASERVQKALEQIGLKNVIIKNMFRHATSLLNTLQAGWAKR